MAFQNSLGTQSPKKGFWSALQALILPPVVPEALAVCIPPGARLRLSDIPSSLQRELDIGPEELVVFNQSSLMPNTYHDGVRFANGRQILLQALKEGQRVLVISLASDESSRHELENGGITQEAVATLSSVHERQMRTSSTREHAHGQWSAALNRALERVMR